MNNIKLEECRLLRCDAVWLLALVRTDVSEERIASIIRLKAICELGTLAVISSQRVSVASYC
jgi:hypothetical protein